MIRLKVCIASHAYPIQPGEIAGVFVRELAEALVRLELDVHAFVPLRSMNPTVLNGVTLHYFRAPSALLGGSLRDESLRAPDPRLLSSSWHALRRLLVLSRSEKFQVVHAHWALPMGAICAMASGFTRTPLVVTTHGRDVYLNPEAGFIVPSLWYTGPLLRWTLRRARAIIAISQDCRAHALRAGAPNWRTQVIYNGTDVDLFRPDVEPVDLRKGLRISPDTTVLLTVRSLNRRKGIHILLRSAARLLARGTLVDVVVVGDGPERQSLGQLSSKLGIAKHVHFLGSINHSRLPAYYTGADIFVIPSLEEGFGIAAIEAMASGKPVVSTDAGGLPEVVHDGATGLVAPRGDVEKLADALDKLIGDGALRKEMGDRGREVVLRRFDWNKVALRTRRLYEEIMRS